uniref:Uncharacterized protein n=1 Tax=Zooxanthella nutricula TaxID=1333877 RepID=A0A7S2I6S1_9DINO|mmetsp:Transcript_14822/g.43940  ORF Transcript_14822/g.43940 Transcript_14822/m.43940 type:complete len:414 (+) Transcript_14822:50-1291(+)
MIVPVACQYLCLQVEFDLGTVAGAPSLPARDHDAAAKKACAQTGIAQEREVTARGREVPSADIQSVQKLPFDSWSTYPTDCAAEEAPAIKFDFCYGGLSGASPRLCVRVLTDLMRYDGVTATRLALHALEALEGAGAEELGETSKPTFAPNPPFPKSGLRALNSLSMLCSIVLDLAVSPYRCLWNAVTRWTVPRTTPEGWLWHYLGGNYEPCEIQVYSPESNKFKDFLAKADQLRAGLGLRRGFLYLLNYSPTITSGVVSSAADLLCVDTKLMSAFREPGPPLLGSQLHIMNLILQRAMMFNNYGRHVHSFKAVPTAFSWDWLNFPGAMTAAFCISINGRFLCGLRGLPEHMELGARILSGGVGGEDPDLENGQGYGSARRMAQVAHHPQQQWGGDPKFLRAEAQLICPVGGQ